MLTTLGLGLGSASAGPLHPDNCPMPDRLALRLTRPAVLALARSLVRAGVSAKALTWLGFAIGLPAAALISTASSFLAFAVMAAKRGLHNLAVPDKSFYFLGRLTEGTETLAFFAACCLWPNYFAPLAYGFAALCGLTLVARVVGGMRAFADTAPKQATSPHCAPRHD